MQFKITKPFLFALCLGMTVTSLPAKASNTAIPKPYQATHGDWTVDCSACTEEFEEVRSMCWMSPKSGEIVLFPDRNKSGDKGYLQWYPPLPENARNVKGSITVATPNAPLVTVPADSVFYADLDGSLIVDGQHYKKIQSVFSKGASATIKFSSSNNGPSGSNNISLKGFAATLGDLNKQAPRYPQKAMCGQQ